MEILGESRLNKKGCLFRFGEDNEGSFLFYTNLWSIEGVIKSRTRRGALLLSFPDGLIEVANPP